MYQSFPSQSSLKCTEIWTLGMYVSIPSGNPFSLCMAASAQFGANEARNLLYFCSYDENHVSDNKTTRNLLYFCSYGDNHASINRTTQLNAVFAGSRAEFCFMNRPRRQGDQIGRIFA
jgi:hypothetical protein